VAISVALVNMILNMGVTRISLRMCDARRAEFGDLFSCYPLLLRYLAGAALYSLICLGGFLLLIVPGIVWSIKFSQYVISSSTGDTARSRL